MLATSHLTANFPIAGAIGILWSFQMCTGNKQREGWDWREVGSFSVSGSLYPLSREFILPVFLSAVKCVAVWYRASAAMLRFQPQVVDWSTFECSKTLMHQKWITVAFVESCSMPKPSVNKGIWWHCKTHHFVSKGTVQSIGKIFFDHIHQLFLFPILLQE